MGWVVVGTVVFGVPRFGPKPWKNTAFFSHKKLQIRAPPKTAVPTTTHPISHLWLLWISEPVFYPLRHVISLWIPNAVVLSAVGRRNTQMSANERRWAQKSANASSQKSANVRKWAQKSASKQPCLKQPGLGTSSSPTQHRENGHAQVILFKMALPLCHVGKLLVAGGRTSGLAN